MRYQEKRRREEFAFSKAESVADYVSDMKGDIRRYNHSTFRLVPLLDMVMMGHTCILTKPDQINLCNLLCRVSNYTLLFVKDSRICLVKKNCHYLISKEGYGFAALVALFVCFFICLFVFLCVCLFPTLLLKSYEQRLCEIDPGW